LLNKNLFD